MRPSSLPAPSMLTLEEPRILAELRRELIGFLHINEKEYHGLRGGELTRALEALEEVKSSVEALSVEQAALRISIPPMLRASRLRQVLRESLRGLFQRDVGLSFRLPGELADTVEAARDLSQDWPKEGTMVLCFTDEETVGEPTRPLVHLKKFLEERASEILAFPINHYDVLCLWRGPITSLVWGPEVVLAEAYAEWVETAVSATARSLQGMVELLEGW